MNFSNQNVLIVAKHSESIGAIYQFQNNERDHFISISSNGEVKEWVVKGNYSDGKNFKIVINNYLI